MIDRKCTRHDWFALRKFSQIGEINSPLPDLHGLLLAHVLSVPAEPLPLGLSCLGAHLSKVVRASALETTVFVVKARCLLHIWPWAILLLLKRC